MQKNKIILAVSLLVPILALLFTTLNNQYILSTGKEMIFPIAAYDPRDLLAGHYLTYTIDYGVRDVCPIMDSKEFMPDAYICLDTHAFSYDHQSNCNVYIKGKCAGNRFTAGVESFYTSERDAAELTQLLTANKASIALSILSNGNARVKYLLIDGKQWYPRGVN